MSWVKVNFMTPRRPMEVASCDVPERGFVEVASIGSSGGALELRPRHYLLTFEHGIDEQGMWATSTSRPLPVRRRQDF